MEVAVGDDFVTVSSTFSFFFLSFLAIAVVHDCFDPNENDMMVLVF